MLFNARFHARNRLVEYETRGGKDSSRFIKWERIEADTRERSRAQQFHTIDLITRH